MPTSARAAAVAASASSNAAADGRRRIARASGKTATAMMSADAGIGRPPADERHREAHQQRPNRAGEVIAGGDDDHRKPAPLDEPVRNIRHHRPEAGPRADPDQHMGGREHGQVRRVSGENEAEPQARRRRWPKARRCRGDPSSARARSSMKASVHIINV